MIERSISLYGRGLISKSLLIIILHAYVAYVTNW